MQEASNTINDDNDWIKKKLKHGWMASNKLDCLLDWSLEAALPVLTAAPFGETFKNHGSTTSPNIKQLYLQAL